jgi:hypothetical protein
MLWAHQIANRSNRFFAALTQGRESLAEGPDQCGDKPAAEERNETDCHQDGERLEQSAVDPECFSDEAE